MNFFYYRDGTLQEGLPLRLLGQGAEILERRAKAGQEAWCQAVLAHGEEECSIQVTSADGSLAEGEGNLRVFSLPAVVRVAQEGEAGLTVNLTRSGAYTVVSGAQAEPDPVLPTPKTASALEQQGYAWLRDGRVGDSSYALCVALTGVEDPAKAFPSVNDFPHDSDDFSRCLGFFEAVPLARPLLESMNQGGPAWQALVPVWDELEQLFAAGQRREVSDRIRDLTSEIELSEDTPFLGRGAQQARRPRP